MIEAEKESFSVAMMCEVLEVSRSGYYAWRDRGPSTRAAEDARLGQEIAAIHAQSRRTYGSPRIHAELCDRGERTGRKRVARLMRARQLWGRRKRRFRCTTDSNHKHPIAPNLLQRRFEAERPDACWVGDITYLWTAEGWLYLAVLLDLHSRRVVGWSMSERLDTELALGALDMALGHRRPEHLVQHTDQGCQYASADYRERLAQHGITASMSRRGDCYDNAVAESFFSTLKMELVYRTGWCTRIEARIDVHEYIEVFYNRQRRHSSLGYRTPVEFEQASRSTQRGSPQGAGAPPRTPLKTKRAGTSERKQRDRGKRVRSIPGVH